MMILPLADALQNCLQDLTSRIAGIDNEQMANRGLGMGTAIGYSLGTIKEQFKTPQNPISQNNPKNMGSDSSVSGFSGIVSRAKSIINPTMNLSNLTDNNGNVNPIRDVVTKKETPSVTMPKSDGTSNLASKHSAKSVVGSVARTGFNATKGYLSIGAKMAEGDFNTNHNKNANVKNNMQRTEYANRTINNSNSSKNTQKLGDENEHKKNS